MKIAKCKLCDKAFNDYLNKSGSLKKHIEKYHFVKYEKSLFLIQEISDIKKFKCPYCEWNTVDITNKSGAFTNHLKMHNKKPEDCVEEYPQLKKLWKTYFLRLENEKFIEKSSDNRIQCKVCKKYFRKLTNKHLLKHNLTPAEYKLQYDITNTNSAMTLKRQRIIMTVEKRNDLSKKIKNVMMNKYGVNSYTQTNKGKLKIKENNIKKYGVNNPMKLKSVKNKLKQTMLRRYGVEHILQSEKIQEKMRLNFFNKLMNSDRLKDKVIPLFTINEYEGTKNKTYKFQCKKCNNIFDGKIQDGMIPRCLVCYPLKNNSMFQREIYEYINSIYVREIIENDRSVISPRELDIYIPDKKIAIECNGNYWHSELQGKDKNYHLDKTEIAEKNNLHLIHIFEDEWLNKQDIVKSKLKNLLGLSAEKTYARKCNIKEIDSRVKNQFLNIHHIQGEDKSKVKLGLFYGSNLVAVMTFGKRRIALGKKLTEIGEWELMRYATSINVVGGAGKLLSYFIRKYNPAKIISYADRRWTYKDNNLYEKLGFDKIDKTQPNYFYMNNYEKRIHRFNFTKHRIIEKLNGDENLTEWENMQLLGYDRIWDCGNLKYAKIL